MYQFLLFIHVFIAIIMVVLVLLQQGKGATAGAAFGSGASQTVFGSRGSGSFLYRFTIGLGICFFLTSIALNNLLSVEVKQKKILNLPMTKQMDQPLDQKKDELSDQATRVKADEIDSAVANNKQAEQSGSLQTKEMTQTAPADTVPQIPVRK